MTRRLDTSSLRLKAWFAGKPIPRYSTKHVHLVEDDDALALAFVRMGGESSPWAIAIASARNPPRIVSVPEPRDRDLVAGMVASVAEDLLRHFGHPEFDGAGGEVDGSPFRQLWLPNSRHLEMLHHLAYAYSRVRKGDSERVKLLRAFGRLCGWLFRESQRPGQQTVVVATDILRSAYSFPSDPIREAHLGYLLAWLTAKGGRTARLGAAETAEMMTVATTMDPSLERDVLEPVLEAWHSKKVDKPRVAMQVARRIHVILATELTRRVELTFRATEQMRQDRRRENAGLAQLLRLSQEEKDEQYIRFELNQDSENDGPAFVISAETDRDPAAAASRYFVTQSSEEFALSALVHDDPQLQDEAIANGDAIRARITKIWDEGVGRAKRPFWQLESSHNVPLRLREGSTLCLGGFSAREVRIRELEWQGQDTLILEVEVTKLITTPRANTRKDIKEALDTWYLNREILLLPVSFFDFSRQKSRKIWTRDVAGVWLTHAKPQGRASTLPDEISDEPPFLTQVGA